jgi:hypothetical protein
MGWWNKTNSSLIAQAIREKVFDEEISKIFNGGVGIQRTIEIYVCLEELLHGINALARKGLQPFQSGACSILLIV